MGYTPDAEGANFGYPEGERPEGCRFQQERGCLLNERRYLLALGGLLHDIGKFALRAGEGGGRLWNDEAQRDFGYKHAELGANFWRDYVPTPWNEGEAYRGAVLHHRPEGPAALAVAAADRLSAGEREKAEGAEPPYLRPILTRVATEAPGEWYTPLEPLKMDESAIFPREGAPAGQPLDQYKALWDDFTGRVKALKEAFSQEGADLAAYLVSLQHLLLRYTWCIPSAAYHAVPDVSLYDHLRMTAALAACLAEEDEEALQALAHSPETSGRQVALLIGGDISGVQDFIYTITPRGALSALRGRSFYLQLLTEAAASYLLRRLGLPPTNLIYAGGGHFYLLAPCTAAQEVTEAQKEISRLLLRHHRGDLYLALACRPLAGCEFFEGRLSQAWEGLIETLRVVKERRFAELGAEMHRLVFAAGMDQGNQERECQVCHHEHPETEEVREGAEAPAWRKCPACRAFEELGDALRRARYLYLEEIPPIESAAEGPAGTYQEIFAALGLRARLLEHPPAEEIASEVLRAQALALDDGAWERLRGAPRLAVGRQWLVNVTPIKNGRVASNDELAKASRGIERLGVLRMDVDNLGQIFGKGLGDRATLSRVASLSLSIRIFFEGWVEALAREENRKRADCLYSIYSGGDDLFFVGAWDAVVALAQRIAGDFAKFSGHNPSVHLSGGLILAGGTYPLYLAANEAKEAEDQAKGLEGKNAISFLGQALPWPLFEQAAQEAHTLDGWVQSGKAPRSLLRHLMRAQEAFAEMAERREREGTAGPAQGYYGPWIPRLEYALARLAERQKPLAAELEALRDRLRSADYRNIAWIGLAARWAELLNRRREDER